MSRNRHPHAFLGWMHGRMLRAGTHAEAVALLERRSAWFDKALVICELQAHQHCAFYACTASGDIKTIVHDGRQWIPVEEATRAQLQSLVQNEHAMGLVFSEVFVHGAEVVDVLDSDPDAEWHAELPREIGNCFVWSSPPAPWHHRALQQAVRQLRSSAKSNFDKRVFDRQNTAAVEIATRRRLQTWGLSELRTANDRSRGASRARARAAMQVKRNCFMVWRSHARERRCWAMLVNMSHRSRMSRALALLRLKDCAACEHRAESTALVVVPKQCVQVVWMYSHVQEPQGEFVYSAMFVRAQRPGPQLSLTWTQAVEPVDPRDAKVAWCFRWFMYRLYRARSSGWYSSIMHSNARLAKQYVVRKAFRKYLSMRCVVSAYGEVMRDSLRKSMEIRIRSWATLLKRMTNIKCAGAVRHRAIVRSSIHMQWLDLWNAVSAYGVVMRDSLRKSMSLQPRRSSRVRAMVAILEATLVAQPKAH